MPSVWSEEETHQFIWKNGIESLIDDSSELDIALKELEIRSPDSFDLWRVIKARAFEKINRIHRSVRYGTLLASKLKLPTDKTKPMELDMVGQHEDGLFILELKVDKGAERNAFSELFAYTNYLSEMFALSGPKDISNVLVAEVSAKITRSAYLYDLLIADRNTIVYRPIFGTDLSDLRLSLHLPSDDDFRYFATQLLTHESMSCLVISFHDLPGWFDSEEEEGSLRDYTKEHLSAVSGYTAQLMEAERLHGFCFIRKRWKEIPSYYGNSLVICAINPFHFADPERQQLIAKQLDDDKRTAFFETASLGFYGRLFEVGGKAIKDTLTHKYQLEYETTIWSSMVTDMMEVVLTHNFGFRPTGIFRQAYTSHLNAIYAANEAGEDAEDVSMLKINEVTNWMRAWEFMSACGFTDTE